MEQAWQVLTKPQPGAGDRPAVEGFDVTVVLRKQSQVNTISAAFE